MIIKQNQPLDVFYKKGFLKISWNSQENPSARASFLIVSFFRPQANKNVIEKQMNL